MSRFGRAGTPGGLRLVCSFTIARGAQFESGTISRTAGKISRSRPFPRLRPHPGRDAGFSLRGTHPTAPVGADRP
jgi:hypothetical protein